MTNPQEVRVKDSQGRMALISHFSGDGAPEASRAHCLLESPYVEGPVQG